MIPLFIDILRRPADGADLSFEEDEALFYIIHLLGEFADPKAFPALIAFLRSGAELVDDVLGDAIATTLNGILISTFGGDRVALGAQRSLSVRQREEVQEML